MTSTLHDPFAPASAAGSPSSTRTPYPYDLLLDTHGLMVRDGIVGKRVLPMANYTAQVQEYATEDLYRERSYVWRRFPYGFGDGSQQGNGDPSRYSFASNTWFAGAYRGLGPRLVPFAATLGAIEGEVAGFVEAVHTVGVTRVFALAGRYIRRWDGLTGASQALSLDLGAGHYVRSWARWAAGGPGQQDALYLTDDRSHLWRYQSAGWTDLTAAGAPAAALVLATGPELWRCTAAVPASATPPHLSKCEADPTVGANWTAPIDVGDASSDVTGLGELSLRLFAFKSDGTVWALQGGIDTGTARDLTPGLRASTSPEHGKHPVAWLAGGLDALYFRGAFGFHRLTGAAGAAAVERIGPERLADNTGPLRGPITAFAGYGTHCAYAAQYNASQQEAYLLQFGAWLAVGAGGELVPGGGEQRFVEAWHGSLLDVPGGGASGPKRITALWVTSHPDVVGRPEDASGNQGNPLLLVGHADGSYGYVRLPRGGPSPFSADAHLAPTDFTDQPSYVTMPRHSLMAPGDTKSYLSVSATGPVLDTSRRVEVHYRVDPTGGPATSPDTGYLTIPTALVAQGQRAPFPEETFGKIIDVREYHIGDPPDPADELAASYTALGTPVVATLTLREQVRPAFRLEYAFILLAHDRVARRDGASDRKTAPQIRNLLADAAQDPGHVTLTLPDETVSRFALIEYQEQVPAAGRLRRRGMAWDLGVSAVQYRTMTQYGRFYRFFRMRFADLTPGFTYADSRTL